VPAPPRLLRRGDEGPLVEKLTKRLSYVRRKGSRDRYLDGARRRLDAEAEAAVKAFQRDHGLDDDGVVGPKTALKLNRAVRLETARHGARRSARTARRRLPRRPLPAGRHGAARPGCQRSSSSSSSTTPRPTAPGPRSPPTGIAAGSCSSASSSDVGGPRRPPRPTDWPR